MGTHTPNHGASSAEGAELELMERLKNVELAGGLAVTAVIPPSRHPYQRKTGGFYVTQGDVDQGGLLPKRLSLSEYDPGLLWHTWALMELKKDPQLMQRAIERACLIRLMVPGATSAAEALQQDVENAKIILDEKALKNPHIQLKIELLSGRTMWKSWSGDITPRPTHRSRHQEAEAKDLTGSLAKISIHDKSGNGTDSGGTEQSPASAVKASSVVISSAIPPNRVIAPKRVPRRRPVAPASTTTTHDNIEKRFAAVDLSSGTSSSIAQPQNATQVHPAAELKLDQANESGSDDEEFVHEKVHSGHVRKSTSDEEYDGASVDKDESYFAQGSTTSVDADEMEVDEDAESRRLAAFALATMDGYYDILPQITDYEYVGRMYDGTKIKPCKRQKTGHDWDGWLFRSNPAPDWA